MRRVVNAKNEQQMVSYGRVDNLLRQYNHKAGYLVTMHFHSKVSSSYCPPWWLSSLAVKHTGSLHNVCLGGQRRWDEVASHPSGFPSRARLSPCESKYTISQSCTPNGLFLTPKFKWHVPHKILLKTHENFIRTHPLFNIWNWSCSNAAITMEKYLGISTVLLSEIVWYVCDIIMGRVI